MKYFIDTEFIEGDVPVKFAGFNIPKQLIKPNNTIQLISIALVSNDGREYYAISKDFNLKEAWNRYDLESYDKQGNLLSKPRKVYWIRENVLKPIYWDMMNMGEPKEYTIRKENSFTYNNFKKLTNKYGKTNKQIAEDIVNFVYTEDESQKIGYTQNQWIDRFLSKGGKTPQFYAYFADYDWVAFCWLFGKMIDLPKGFPKYCRDLKQEIDVTYTKYEDKEVKPISLKSYLEGVKLRPDYPKQSNEHNALADARWNKRLYNFIKQL